MAVDLNDLFQSGVVGLLSAVETYESSENGDFENYAKPRIEDSIFGTLRQLFPGFSVRSASPLHPNGLAAAEYTTPPSSPARSYVYRHREEPATPDVTTGPESQPDLICELQELRLIVARAIWCLPKRHRKVLLLHYYSGLTMAQIGGELGVSATRVAQIRMLALRKISTNLPTGAFSRPRAFAPCRIVRVRKENDERQVHS